MGQNSESFERQLQRGRVVEEQVADWLMGQGRMVLPVYEYSGLGDGKAPKLLAIPSSASLVVPDLLVVAKGKTLWIEVKYKSHADFTHITQRRETGISQRLWGHYQRVQTVTGLPVWILFVHEKEDELRAGALTELNQNKRAYNGGKMGGAGMYFFPYNELRCLGHYSDLPIAPS